VTVWRVGSRSFCPSRNLSYNSLDWVHLIVSEFGLTSAICSQCIGSRHMAQIERKKTVDGFFWQQNECPLIKQLASCSSFGGWRRPTVGAKLLPGITARMWILKDFHKSSFRTTHWQQCSSLGSALFHFPSDSRSHWSFASDEFGKRTGRDGFHLLK